MADELDALLARVDDVALRGALGRHIDRLRTRREFGLVFENHLPETVRLPDHPIRRGAAVVFRNGEREVWSVDRRDGDEVAIGREGEPLRFVSESDLVVVAEFGDSIYPGLQRTEEVRRGGEKAPHVVINAENFHALQLLQFTHAGKVDCIYIDPPYNTGARDWKYNNNYVDDSDGWRHSKWLSFIERRLRLARPLLCADGVLVVTIDEHEVQHLGLLLRQLFPDARVQMVTIVTNTAGQPITNQFTRADEYAYFCFFGSASVSAMEHDLLSDSKPKAQYWFPLFRSRGLNDRPSKRKNLVYPIAVDPERLTIEGYGRTLDERVSAGEVSGDLDEWLPDPKETLNGLPVVWPILDTGEMATWQLGTETLMRLYEEGFVRVRAPRKPSPRAFTLSYVKDANQKLVRAGAVTVRGREPNTGAFILQGGPRTTLPKTTWKIAAHDARLYGTTMLRSLVGANSFSYPKSPYAVRDTLAAVLSDRPDAVVLDFFAGSGTTLQATALLNSHDGGTRRSILVTNNEVGENEARAFAARGIRAGDPEWEARGIYELVTRPRCRAAVTGMRADGTPVEGEYLDGMPLADGFEENVDFLRLTYLDPIAVELNRAFEAIAPLLWMRAGGVGEVIDRCEDSSGLPLPYSISANYGILFDTDRWSAFVDELPSSVRTVFIVTDSYTVFSHVVAELPQGVASVRLYENYLTTFAFTQG